MKRMLLWCPDDHGVDVLKSASATVARQMASLKPGEAAESHVSSAPRHEGAIASSMQGQAQELGTLSCRRLTLGHAAPASIGA